MQEQLNDAIWSAIYPDDYIWAEWPDEPDHSIFYHRASGKLLLLNPLGSHLLKKLQATNMTGTQLQQSVASNFDVDLDVEILNAIDLALVKFQESGLVELKAP